LKLSLVAIPVKAYPATTSGPETHLHQLHAGCGQRLRHEKRCPVHGPIEAGAIVSGYQYAPGQCVPIDEAELAKLRPACERALTLERCLDGQQPDPALFSGRSLYLLPDGPAAQHAYTVLTQALHQRGKAALGRVVLSGRRQLVFVRPAGRLLTAHVLHDPTLLRPSAVLEAELRSDTPSPDEADLAGRLLDAASQPIPWADYRDDTAERLATLVDATLQGRRLEAPADDEPPVLHLLDALKQSVAQALGQTPTSTTPRRRRPTRKTVTRRAS
jgi:DNA end-binding protein Ku